MTDIPPHLRVPRRMRERPLGSSRSRVFGGIGFVIAGWVLLRALPPDGSWVLGGSGVLYMAISSYYLFYREKR